MQVNRSGGLEELVHFQEQHRHVNQIRLVALAHRRVNDFVETRMLCFNQIEPCNVRVLQRLGVLELHPCSFTPYRNRVVRFRIEWRI